MQQKTMKDKRGVIAIAGDHAGFSLKDVIVRHLEHKGFLVRDYGTFNDESVDYPDFVHPLAEAVAAGTHDKGIVICGSGNGVSMTANKHGGIRAALSWMPEIARLARAHNDANVLALPARFIEESQALETVDVFLNTVFEGGRHLNRIRKI